MKNNRWLGISGFVVYDFIIAFLSTIFSFLLFKLPLEIHIFSQFILVSSVWCLCTVFGLYFVKIYNILWRYSSVNEMLRIFVGCILPFLAVCIFELIVFGNGISLSLYVLNYFITVTLILAQRFFVRWYPVTIKNNSNDTKTTITGNVMIIGAGAEGEAAIRELSHNSEVEIKCARKVEIEDLLGREPIDVNLDSVLSYVENQVILVTGGGGTIGSELCRQIAAHNPKQLIIFDIYENNAYEIQNELKHSYPELDLITLVGSVRDSKRIDYVFRTYKPQIVYHAAAHKHVPLMEDSPNESIKNNVFGTYNTAECADKYNVKRFVLISTDKAVNPTNIMGASKRICEMIVQAFNEKSKTEFVAVRFGNVLGSNGSVIPLFKKQIEQGGPLTVTDPNVIRYFMTIPEAVSLVLQAGADAKGGEIFVLDMGQPVKILSLAEKLIRLSGYEPYKDIDIVFTGCRPGEKLYEELLMSEEGLTATSNKHIHIDEPIDIDTEVLFKTLDQMREVMYDETADIRKLVKAIVPTYQIHN